MKPPRHFEMAGMGSTAFNRPAKCGSATLAKDITQMPLIFGL
jgi:hypothetical protein